MEKLNRSHPLTLLCLSLISATLACRFGLSTSKTAPTPTPPAIPGIEQLVFDNAATGTRFKALNLCTNNLTDANWRTTSYQLIGNFYESRWCAGKGASHDCQIASSTQDNRDQHTISLSTLFYPDELPQVFGLSFSALWVPPATGWGASFYFSEQGKSVMGEGWGVRFSEYTASSGEAQTVVTLGSGYEYKILTTTFQVSAEASPRDDLSSYLKSAEAMRVRGLQQIQALADKVTSALQQHQIPGCDYTPYQNDGIPPACIQRPMTAAEESAELQEAREYFDTQTRLLTEHYNEMYAAWMKSFPFDTCWQ